MRLWKIKMTNKIKNILRKIKTLLLMIEGAFTSKRNLKSSPEFSCTKSTKRCFYHRSSPNYRYEYFSKNTPICCATHLYSLLKDVTDVMHSNRLEYFVSFGTLLGAMRHQGMIPWDTDVDLVVPLKKKDETLTTLQNILGDKYVIKEVKEECIVGHAIRIYLSEINTLHVDLFFYIEEDNNIIFGYDRKFLKEEVFPLSFVSYYDLSLYAPKNKDQQLQKFYGKDYMKFAYRQWAWNKKKFRIIDFSPAEIKLS